MPWACSAEPIMNVITRAQNCLHLEQGLGAVSCLSDQCLTIEQLGIYRWASLSLTKDVPILSRL